MAEIPVQRSGGSGGGVPTWAVAALALVLVGGFMVWLGMTAEPTNVQVVPEEAPVDSTALAAAQVPSVPLLDFAENTEQYEGQQVRLDNVPVDSRLGERGLWLKMPNQGLYLVQTAPDAPLVQPGQNITAVGTVQPMTDSIVTAWLDQGLIQPEQEIEARYATSFLDASYIGAPLSEAVLDEAAAARAARGEATGADTAQDAAAQPPADAAAGAAQ